MDSHESRSGFPRKIVLLRKKFHFYSVLFLADFEGDSGVEYGVGKVFCRALEFNKKFGLSMLPKPLKNGSKFDTINSNAISSVRHE